MSDNKDVFANIADGGMANRKNGLMESLPLEKLAFGKIKQGEKRKLALTGRTGVNPALDKLISVLLTET